MWKPILLSPPKAVICLFWCGTHHRVPHTTSLCSHGADANGQCYDLALGERGRVPVCCMVMVALPHHALHLWFALLCSFAATGPAKLG